MEISCVFFSEFDIHAGPCLLFQYPSEYLNIEQFKLISFFVIPNHSLCSKLNILRLSELYLDSPRYIVSMPICIENPGKYKRGSYEFNVCFLIPESTHSNHSSLDILT